MSVTIRKRKNTDETITLRLDIYHNGQRWYETLKDLRLEKPSTPLARSNNRQMLLQAEAIRVARAAELQANDYGMVSDKGKKVVVVQWLEDYAASYTKKDYRNMVGAIDKFETYLQCIGQERITFVGLTALILDDFVEYLNEHQQGEGANSYWGRLKKAIRVAYKKRLMKDNVLDFTEKKANAKARMKDVLSIEEIKLLAVTPVASPEVKNAALFTCMTGLRWIDMKALKWDNIDLENNKVSITQSKTGNNATIHLNESAKALLGIPSTDKEALVFDLPSANGANKTIKAWVKRAGIDKKITFHNLRHSFGTNLIATGTDVVTASKLLGHSSLKHTQRYVHEVERLKIDATNKLNF